MRHFIRSAFSVLLLVSAINAGCTKEPPPSLHADKLTAAPGESITVHFVASKKFPDNAWVGIIPSNVPHGNEAVNDQYDLTYQYLKKQAKGTLTFTAPPQPGNYDFRMHDTDSNGKEVASVSFTVEGVVAPAPASGEAGSLILEKTAFAPGEAIQVRFTSSEHFPSNAWVGIIPSNVPHGSEATNDQHDLTYQYLQNRLSGMLTFTAPPQMGQYDLRLHSTDDNGVEVASVSFTVK